MGCGKIPRLLVEPFVCFFTFNMNCHLPSIMCDVYVFLCVYEVLLVVLEHLCYIVLMT